MRNQLLLAAIIGTWALLNSAVFASNSAGVSIYTEVAEMIDISIADSSINMVIDRALPGMDPAPVIRGTYYNASLNSNLLKLTAVFGDDWITTPGMSFEIDPGANPMGGGQSLVVFDSVNRTNIAQDLMPAAVAGVYTEKLLTFTFTATAASGTLASSAHTLTLTFDPY